MYVLMYFYRKNVINYEWKLSILQIIIIQLLIKFSLYGLTVQRNNIIVLEIPDDKICYFFIIIKAHHDFWSNKKNNQRPDKRACIYLFLNITQCKRERILGEQRTNHCVSTCTCSFSDRSKKSILLIGTI